MKQYNKSGDIIHTSLYGGEKIAKDSLIVDAYGTIDELNTFVALARSRIEDADIKSILHDIQKNLLKIGSDLATPLDKEPLVKRIPKDSVVELEKIIEKYEKDLSPINRFIVPGGAEESSLLHIVRSIARRAERRLVTLKKEREINENIAMYLNRLSDLMFTLARLMNKRKGVSDELWVR